MSHIYEHLNKGYFLPLFIFSKLLIKFLWNFPVNYVDVRTKIYKMYQICVAWDIPTKLRVNNQLGISLTVWQSYQEVTIKCPWEFLGVSPGILLLDAHINSHCPHLGPWCSSSQQDFFFSGSGTKCANNMFPGELHPKLNHSRCTTGYTVVCKKKK